MKRTVILSITGLAIAVAAGYALSGRLPARQAAETGAGTGAATAGTAELAGAIEIEGSGMLSPLTKLAARKFTEQHPKVAVRTITSHTAHGLQRLVGSKTDLCNASRPITDNELAIASKEGIEVIELTVAFSGLAVVVSKNNDFAQDITTDELRAIWEDRSRVKLWSEVRSSWPAEPIALVGQDLDSGTYGYFAESIIGKGRKCRRDIAIEADSDQLVETVWSNPYAMSYVDLDQLTVGSTSQRLRALPIDNGQGPVLPSAETVRSGDYTPLSRPLMIYVTKAAAERPEVGAFIGFYLENGRQVATALGCVPLSDTLYQLENHRFQHRITGTVY